MCISLIKEKRNTTKNTVRKHRKFLQTLKENCEIVEDTYVNKNMWWKLKKKLKKIKILRNNKNNKENFDIF